jgi:shikimate kinase
VSERETTAVNANGRGGAQRRMVLLVGFMGAGKTTAGRRLAARLGWRFEDLDDVIERRTGREVKEIFRAAGEAAFRALEAEALATMLAQNDATGEPLVLALGGGAFVQPPNAAAVRATGHPVVFLDAAPDELRRRCAEHGDRRPLYQDAEQFARLYASRRAAYLAAGLRVDTTGLTVEEVVEALLRWLGIAAAPEGESSTPASARQGHNG